MGTQLMNSDMRGPSFLTCQYLSFKDADIHGAASQKELQIFPAVVNVSRTSTDARIRAENETPPVISARASECLY